MRKLLDGRFPWLKNRSVWRGLPIQCKICLRPFKGKVKRVVDHDHKSGKIRDWICDTCNAGLGMFHDNSETILRAYGYLIHFKNNLAIDYIGRANSGTVDTTVPIEYER